MRNKEQHINSILAGQEGIPALPDIVGS